MTWLNMNINWRWTPLGGNNYENQAVISCYALIPFMTFSKWMIDPAVTCSYLKGEVDSCGEIKQLCLFVAVRDAGERTHSKIQGKESMHLTVSKLLPCQSCIDRLQGHLGTCRANLRDHLLHKEISNGGSSVIELSATVLVGDGVVILQQLLVYSS